MKKLLSLLLLISFVYLSAVGVFAADKIEYKAYFKRNQNSIDGVFTLHKIVNGKVIEDESVIRHPARSGQWGFQNTFNVTAKSPIPSGKFYLWTKPTNGFNKVPDKALKENIGEFYPISSTLNSCRIIYIPHGERVDVGLHLENWYPGSAGCIVLVWQTPYYTKDEALFADVLKIRKLFREASRARSQIPLEVIQ